MTPKIETKSKKQEDATHFAVRNGREIATVDIYRENYERMKPLAEELGKGMKPYTNEILDIVVSAALGARMTYPTLKLVDVKENAAYVEDTKKQEIAKVVSEKGKLKCWADKSDSCDHCNFVRADVLTFGKISRAGHT